MRPVAFLLCCCFFVTVQAQTSYYVSPDGSNAGDGNMASPWPFVQFGLEHIVPGDTLNLREGSLHRKIAIPFSGITLRVCRAKPRSLMPGSWHHRMLP